MDNHSSSIQRQRIIDHLQVHGSASTIELRHELDVMMPAARIFELRHGHKLNIVRTWDYATNPEGTIHRVARYALLSGEYKGGEK